MDPIKTRILAAYQTLAERYNALIDHKPHNAYYDRPNTLALVPNPQGASILDAACGPGKYAEILLAQGAQVTGFDLSPKMVELAQARNPTRGHFFVHDLTAPFHMLENESFDTVLCALAMDYVADWTLTLKEFHRVLKPGGHLVLSIEHPFFKFNSHGYTRYFEVTHVREIWKGFLHTPVEVNSYRRPLGACTQALTESGFYIDQLVEPKPTAEFERADPRHYKELNEFPAFLCLRGVKRPK